jgi:hypothetical protein
MNFNYYLATTQRALKVTGNLEAQHAKYTPLVSVVILESTMLYRCTLETTLDVHVDTVKGYSCSVSQGGSIVEETDAANGVLMIRDMICGLVGNGSRQKVWNP